MKILFLGAKKTSSNYQFLSLKKNYKKVDLIDGYKSFFFDNNDSICLIINLELLNTPFRVKEV